jgi:hypothetical protein
MYHYRSQVNASPVDQRTGYHTPASRDQGFSPATVHDGGFETSLDSLPESTGLKSLQRSYTSDHNGPEHQQLSPNEMIAPASAVHSMSVNLLGSNDVSDAFLVIGELLYILTVFRYSWTTQTKGIPEAMLLIEESSVRSSLARCMTGMSNIRLSEMYYIPVPHNCYLIQIHRGLKELPWTF